MIVTPTATTSDAINPHFLFIYALLYTLHTSSMNENETRVAFQTFGIRALGERAEEKLQFFCLNGKASRRPWRHRHRYTFNNTH